jgi:hypothetical protein
MLLILKSIGSGRQEPSAMALRAAHDPRVGRCASASLPAKMQKSPVAEATGHYLIRRFATNDYSPIMRF